MWGFGPNKHHKHHCTLMCDFPVTHPHLDCGQIIYATSTPARRTSYVMWIWTMLSPPCILTVSSERSGSFSGPLSVRCRPPSAYRHCFRHAAAKCHVPVLCRLHCTPWCDPSGPNKGLCGQSSSNDASRDFSSEAGRHKKIGTLLDLCVSSLRRGHANLLCIVPILSDDPRRESKYECATEGPDNFVFRK